jgi:hypothetical protein
MSIAALAPTRSRKQQSHQSSGTTWTAEEDALLIRFAQGAGSISWSGIAKHFPSKTAPQLAGRWEKVLNPRLVKGSWTREEDEIILGFVQSNGDKDWAKLAGLLSGRTGKQCRERFKNHLDPSLARVSWTPEEDQKLIDLHNSFGNQWTKLASFFNGRTDNCVKNRWNSTIKKRLERLEKGEPLVMKRGRKPKSSQYDSKINMGGEATWACSSPLEPPPVPGFVPLADQFALNLPFYVRSKANASSLQQNRLELSKLLNSISA